MFTVTQRDHPAPLRLPRLTVRSFFAASEPIPVHPDFAWMWLTGLLVFSAAYSCGALYSCAGLCAIAAAVVTGRVRGVR
jgi:hypothetical protein